MNDQKEKEVQGKLEHRRIAEFSEDYANNTLFQSSNWDLKIIFGELEQSLGPNVVLQHTAITVPWSQVKLMVYFMTISLIFQEAQNGRIAIPSGLIPEIGKQMPKELREAGTTDAAWQAVRQLYEQFVAANPEAAPKKKPQ